MKKSLFKKGNDVSKEIILILFFRYGAILAMASYPSGYVFGLALGGLHKDDLLKFVLFAGITCAWSFSLGMLVSVRMVLGEGLEGLTALSMVAVVMFNSGVGVLITVIFQKFIGAAIEVKLENDLTV